MSHRATSILMLTAAVWACALACAQEGGIPPSAVEDEASIRVDVGEATSSLAPTSSETGKHHLRGALPLVGGQIKQAVVALTRDKTGQWWTIPQEKVSSLYLLPCENLEMMEDILKESPAARFRISGEFQFFHGKYYLLPGEVAQLLDESAVGPATRPGATAAAFAAVSSGGAATRATASAPAASQPTTTSAETSASDIANALLSPPPVRPLLTALPTGRAAEPTTSVAPAGKPAVEGSGRRVADRHCRLVRDEDKQTYWLAFESDNTLTEPPLRVLPNFFLQKMAMESGDGQATGATFYVTGDIHRYRGGDYVYLRSSRLVPNLGQF